ncbi:MAG: hypothetical protein JXL84_23715 [Deltaproteobacteria bacterium]|nr:hypothetical protein [Deltaproteobacteria bacterium]
MPWDTLARRINSMVGQAHPEGREAPPAEGSICLVKQERGRWKDGYFYNPPAVLVLERSESLSDAVLVAQTYHDVTLAGPGDLILPKDRSPLGEMFVEAWNTYTLRLRDLTPSPWRVEQSVLQALKTLESDPAAYPEWALHPRPMDSEDPRIYFREMEVEVGYVFSSVAASGLIDELEGGFPRLAYSTLGEAVNDIREKAPGIRWLREPVSIEQALATALFPPERYALAAASEDRDVSHANLVTVRSGRVIRIEPIEAEVFERFEESGGLVIGGCLSPPPDQEILEVLCFLQTRDGDFVSPEKAVCDEKGHFRARFPGSFMDESELYVAAIREATDA